MDILMPQLGETVTEGRVVAWYKSVGDAVAPGDSLFEIETEKTSMDVPTTQAGVLSEIRVAAGGTVPVGAVVAVVTGAANARHAADGDADGASIQVPHDPFHAVRTPPRNYGPAARRDGVKLTPVARRLAAEAGLDVDRLVGSGPHGHVLARDVRAAAGAHPAQTTAPPPLADSAASVKELFRGVPFEEVRLDAMRRTVARRLLAAKQTIPHFYLTLDVMAERLVALRRDWNAQAEGGLKLSLNDFIIRALALALQRVPQANAVWAEDAILRFRHSDLAVAVAVEDGLYTPVIRQAELKSVGQIGTEMRQLAERARSRTLKPDEYRGGSMTISNLGMHGVRSFAAIVNPPHAAILAVGACERRPTETAEGTVRFADHMTVTLSCDHRVIDGVLGAKLLGAFKALVEAPLRLLG